MTPTWHQDRYCATNQNADHWTDEHAAGYGIHWCRHHCPVFNQCKAEQEANPQPGVYAGVLWVQTFVRGRVTPTPTRVAGHQPKELWCTSCQLSSVSHARTRTAQPAAEAPGATVVIGLAPVRREKVSDAA